MAISGPSEMVREMGENVGEHAPAFTALVQVRLGSMRLPGKALLQVGGKPLLAHLIERLGRSRKLDAILLVIPVSSINDPLEQLANDMKIGVFRGSELDVLDRFAGAAKRFLSKNYVRITGDCPIVDPEVVDGVIEHFSANNLDYARTGKTFPDGLDVEVFTSEALETAQSEARDNFDREHVTPWIRRFYSSELSFVEYPEDLSRLRLTVDEPEDLSVISEVFGAFSDNTFTVADVSQLASARPELFVPNQHLERDGGSSLSSGEKLWRRAIRVVAGGTMLFSKRPDLYATQGWPTYFSRTQGCKVWDLDGRPFIDVGLMGVGTNVLGYSNPEVDEAVREVIQNGNMSSLIAPEEVFLAEELVAIHPWAGKARFARSGGEACAVALRIARAASGKDGVAFCGYHGWHDWYLSANLLSGSSLDTHLLPGLSPKGVPKALKGSSLPFRYNEVDALEKHLESGAIGCIFMEVERNIPPATGFLESVKALSKKYGAVLVFDECTSGFRTQHGGLHLGYGVEPDLVTLGKTLGNGYAVSAVLGTDAVMQQADSSFISSTFWSERIGSVAGLKTLEVMKREDSPKRLVETGLRVRRGWGEIANSNGLKLEITGIVPLSSYTVTGYGATEVKTFVTREMLRRGFLAPPSIYVSLAHTEEIVEVYLASLNDVFRELSKIDPEDLGNVLGGKTVISSFSRLN